jgi:hypothetical protein
LLDGYLATTRTGLVRVDFSKSEKIVVAVRALILLLLYLYIELLNN